MARRYRRPTDTQEFEDPLSNYEPRDYEDELERSLAEDQVGSLKITPFFPVEPDMTVGDVIRTMSKRNLFCALVIENDKLIGIFSERDVLEKVSGNFSAVQDQPIRKLMTAQPATVYDTDVVGKVINLMAVGGFRHVPVLDVNDRLIGILGPRRIVKILQKQFS